MRVGWKIFLNFIVIALSLLHISSCGNGLCENECPAGLGVSGASSIPNEDGTVTVTITGTGFTNGMTVTVNGVSCTNVNVLSSTQLTCVLPNGSIALVNIVVTSPSGGSSSGGGGSTSVTKYTTTVTNDSAVGSVSWSNPSNATSDDSSFAGVMGIGQSNYLKATSFGFNIPSTATITGITAEILVYCFSPGETGEGCGPDTSVKIVNAGGTIGGSSSTEMDGNNSFLDETEVTFTYGGSSVTWGETWTPDNINDSDFGVAFSSTRGSVNQNHLVDYVRITVHYTY